MQTWRPVLHGSMQNHAGPKNMCKKTREICIRQSSMGWGEGRGVVFSLSPPKPATDVKKKSIMVGPL
jgi:hypothetical protein